MVAPYLKKASLLIALVALVALAPTAMAAPPASPPATASGICPVVYINTQPPGVDPHPECIPSIITCCLSPWP